MPSAASTAIISPFQPMRGLTDKYYFSGQGLSNPVFGNDSVDYMAIGENLAALVFAFQETFGDRP